MQTSDLCSRHQHHRHICAQLAPRADASLVPTQPPTHHAVCLLLVFPIAPTVPHLASSPHLPAWAASSDTAFWLWPSAFALAQAPGSTPPQLGHQAFGLPSQPTGHRPTRSAHPNRRQTQGPDCSQRWVFCREGKVFGSTEQEGSSQHLGVSTLDFHLTAMAKEA